MEEEWEKQEEVNVTLEQESVVNGLEGLMVYLNIPKIHWQNVNKYRDLIAHRSSSLANKKLLQSNSLCFINFSRHFLKI
jgi:hypothetical protein